jgi:hypothetical protein
MKYTLTCDIAIIGGSMGGVAAALSACDSGMSVILIEETDWLGGQMTCQGVSALDEHKYIEQFGGTARYYRLRDNIRAQTRRAYPAAPEFMPDGAPLNPGDGWVSSLCFDPRFGLVALQEMVQPHLESGRLQILLEHIPVSATVYGSQIRSVTLHSKSEDLVTIGACYFLDATDLGDLLPLTGVDYVTGAESQAETGETMAELEANPQTVQGFTSCFFVEFRPGENHVIAQPEGYERLREARPYTLRLKKPDGTPYPFKFFVNSETGNPPFWTYRRVRSADLVAPGGTDIALINWESNDYHWKNILDVSREARAGIIDESKHLSLGFLYWLQTEVPRDEGGFGYPELRLCTEITATADGLAKFPYIRESRRIVAHKHILEQDISVHHQPGARAKHFTDTLGIGWYNIDVHSCVGSSRSIFTPTRPFQIPLGALLPRNRTNLLAACKNLGVTHITNGAYRLHPVEWNIGESAGALAAFCIKNNCTPEQIWQSQYAPGLKTLLRKFQRELARQGIPLGWSVDVPQGHENFVETQLLLALGIIAPDCNRFADLEIHPGKLLSVVESKSLEGHGIRNTATWQDACQRVAALMAD